MNTHLGNGGKMHKLTSFILAGLLLSICIEKCTTLS